MTTDLVIIGAGPAGLAAACSAKESGIESITILERDVEAGGILNQCIHSGFGLRYFKEELTGPEYAERFLDRATRNGINIFLDTMAISVSPNLVKALDAKAGLIEIETKAVILAMGCRERTRQAIAIPGTRPSGVMTAGLAQRYVNIEGKMIGKRVVILGSGDIGLIMARRMTLEGATVLACVELMPYSSGLSRNIAQCLDDYEIPLLLSHTVTDIKGRERLTGVTVMKVDEKRRPIPGSEIEYDCDTLLLSVGLIPENELTAAAGIEIDPRTKGPVVFDNNETSVPGIFASGNVLQVHDLVDYVTEEGERAGKAAAAYILSGNQEHSQDSLGVSNGENVSYTVPQRIKPGNADVFDLYFRVRKPIRKGDIVIRSEGTEIRRMSREHMAPGEMELVKLAKKTILGDIVVSVEETV